MSLTAIAHCVGGQQRGDDVMLERVCTDTRQLQPGDLFVALQGEHFDGNHFVHEAAQQGAAAALVTRPCERLPSVQVSDSRYALGLLGRENRRRFDGPLVAITGSSGKTSTKELLAAILRQCGEVFATRGNFNNEVGVPLSLLELAPEHRYAVIEMGAAKRGDIAYLCQFAEPTIAILTNAQAAHIQGFKSLQGVAETKGEIFAGLGSAGVAVINADDPHCPLWQQLAAGSRQRLFSVSREDVDVYATDIEGTEPQQSRFTLHADGQQVAVQLPLPGKHMVANALAAATAALAAGASLAQIAAGLASAGGVVGRLSSKQLGGCTVIDDSYNANPGSVAAAIAVLAAYPGRRILALGPMAELGEEAAQLHRQVASEAAGAGLDGLFVFGEFAPQMTAAFGAGAFAFKDREALAAALIDYLKTGDTVLIKGSRSAGMECVLAALSQTLAGEAR